MKKKSTIERPQIRPQKWYQEKVLSSSADILISWAAAGVGKTFALIMETTRYIHIPTFWARGFRRTTQQIRNQGWLWDTSREIYPSCWWKPRESELEWIFPSGAKVKFSHLEHEKNILDHQGAQYPLILFDELTHFTKKQFLYLLSRNRSVCWVSPYVRATCNPDPDSWVRELVDPWIWEDGFPIPEMEGKILYMMVDAWKFIFAETPEELIEKLPHVFALIPDSVNKRDIIKSITFISWNIYENKKLIEADPSYLWNLLSQSEEDRKTLLEGNWNVRVDGLSIFNHAAIQDLFTNKIEHWEKTYITVDVARQWVDLAVVKVWKWWVIVEIQILTKCRTTELTALIERMRAKYSVPKRQVAVDQDWVWGWVMDEWQDGDSGYFWFSGWAPAMEDPKTKIKELYADLKTQCAYRIWTRVNESKISIDENVIIYVDWEETDIVKTEKDGEVITYRKLLSQDLRSFKRAWTDDDKKKKMISKSGQKSILWRSPDCGDTFIEREIFELIPEEEVVVPGFFIY